MIMEQQLTSRRRRTGVLLICCLSLFMVGLDMTVVNVALPSIGRELGAEVSGLQWPVDAYPLVMASRVIARVSLTDRFGRGWRCVTGLVVFTAASVACGLAPGVGSLIAFRALQAVSASMLNPVAMSIIA